MLRGNVRRGYSSTHSAGLIFSPYQSLPRRVSATPRARLAERDVTDLCGCSRVRVQKIPATS